MRHAVTIVRQHGSATHELLLGPDVPVREQKQHVKDLLATRDHPQYAEVHFFDSRSRHRTFLPAEIAITPTGTHTRPAGLPNIPATPPAAKKAAAKKAAANRSTGNTNT